MAGGPKQTKRVSWASGVNLCQVRLFLSEDAPSQSGLAGSQDHLQAKAAWLLHSSSAALDDSIPPGFEGFHRSQIQINIPSVKWQCPPNQCLNPEWLVVAGEESLEVALQNQRQLGVLEAVYPRSSSIPPDPCVSPEVQLAHFDDSQTLLIPIIAVEDDDAVELDTDAPNTISSYVAPLITECSMTPVPKKPVSTSCSILGSETSVKPDIAAAASAAFTAIMRSNEEGSLVDRDLLIKILTDPSMVEKLVAEHSASKQATILTQPQETSHVTNFTFPMPSVAPSLTSVSPFSTTIPVNMPTIQPKSSPARDVNYYKSLIQKHGDDRQELTELSSTTYESHHDHRNDNLGSIYRGGREMGRNESRKPKIAKPCVYFNTPRGCRQGAGCSYLHDSSMSKKIDRQRGSKRVKFDR